MQINYRDLLLSLPKWEIDKLRELLAFIKIELIMRGIEDESKASDQLKKIKKGKDNEEK